MGTATKRQRERIACGDIGITLIEIPYLWNFEKSSLIAPIHKRRSDLFSSEEHGKPIPNQPFNGIPEGKYLKFSFLHVFLKQCLS